MSSVYDLVGIGFGPANIALAIALEDDNCYPNCLFLEKALEPVWQEEMLFDESLDIHSNIQNIPFRDLVTPHNPRSRYTFLNYLHETNRLFGYLNMDLLMPMRPDYAAYIKWVGGHFADRLLTGVSVSSVNSSLGRNGDNIYRITADDGHCFSARHVVIGIGRPAFIPKPFRSIRDPRVFHLSRYKSSLSVTDRPEVRRIAVIGSSQSALEILLHVNDRHPDAEIHSIFRRFGYPLKDTNPFMSEIYFPEFTDFYYSAPPELKKRIDRDVYRTNYGACDMDVLEELYRRIYYQNLRGERRFYVRRLTEVRAAQATPEGIRLNLVNLASELASSEYFDVVVLATGFMNLGEGESNLRTLPILDGLAEELHFDASGCVQVDRDYCLALKPRRGRGSIVMNGLCETTHGMGDAGSLSLVSLRAQRIVKALKRQDGLVAMTNEGRPFEHALD
jgi:L-ornithine N5-monooxygenase